MGVTLDSADVARDRVAGRGAGVRNGVDSSFSPSQMSGRSSSGNESFAGDASSTGERLVKRAVGSRAVELCSIANEFRPAWLLRVVYSGDGSSGTG